MTEAEVLEKVRQVLVDALGVDEEDVAPGASLMADLGAESIDFLDITFQLEKAFDIKIPRGELIPDNFGNNPDFVRDGKLTDIGLAELKARMPHVDFTEIEDERDIGEIMNQFRVQTVVNYVMAKVN